MKNTNNKRHRKRRHKIRVGILIIEIIVFIFAISLLALFFMPNSKAKIVSAFTQCSLGRKLISCAGEDDYNKNVLNSDFNREDIKKSTSALASKEYINIALFGIDPRDGEFESATHTDSIIIVTVNTKTSAITLTSIYRDTLMRMTDMDGDMVLTKANNAYFYGGPEEAISTLNTNLDLSIEDYAIVNFSGLATIIDALGGIDVNITDEEQFYINGYLVETREVTGMDAPDVEKSGAVHLTGLQATAYCRIRYTDYTDAAGNVLRDDYGRTARQRYVMTQIFNLAQTAGTEKIIKTAKTLLNNDTLDGEKIMETSLSWDTILDLIPIAMECSLGTAQGYPYEKYTPEKGNDYYGYVVPVGLVDNVTQLQNSLFPDSKYTPSTVLKSISNEIIDETGIEPETEDNDNTSSQKDSYNRNNSYNNNNVNTNDDDNDDMSDYGANDYYQE